MSAISVEVLHGVWSDPIANIDLSVVLLEGIFSLFPLSLFFGRKIKSLLTYLDLSKEKLQN